MSESQSFSNSFENQKSVYLIKGYNGHL